MRIHMLGIGGTGMASLAGLLKEAGHEVTGTDNVIYPPMSDQLANLNIKPFVGYAAANIEKANPELVVIGNVIRRENPEAQETLKRNLTYTSMPAAVSDLFLRDRAPLVVTGTHGKTTSSNLAAWLLTELGEDPGFLIGGIGLNFNASYRLGTGRAFVIEGDEYDSAFFDKGPKFLHYKPHVLIITSIEFDHADIYRDLQGIIRSFERLVAIMPQDGVVVANADDATVMSVVSKASCRVKTYGEKEKADYRLTDLCADQSGTSFKLSGIDDTFRLPMWGRHNAMNASGVIAALVEGGHKPQAINMALAGFKGIRRRQELVAEVEGIAVIDDFAHHPTAVAETISSMRSRFPGRRIVAVFEPRSNTSRRNFFQHEFAIALASADRAIIASPFNADAIPDGERFDPQAAAREMTGLGCDAHHIPETAQIVESLTMDASPGDVMLIMSNGAFDGIHGKFVDALKKRKGMRR